MKDQFGKDWEKNTMDKDRVRNDASYDDRDKNMRDLERHNRERVVNVQGDRAFTDRERDMTDRERDMTERDKERSMSDMDRNEQVLVGIFGSVQEANNVIIRLKEIGYREDDITVLAKDKEKMDRLKGTTENKGRGAAIGGTLGGVAEGLIVAFSKMGINEADARNYEHHHNQGKIIILVENREKMRDEVFNTYRQNNNFNDIHTPRF